MPADTDTSYPRKPFMLTLKGKVTVYYLDGQTLEGEMTAQDELNIWLTIDNTPHLIARQQIRYIKGRPGQAIEPESGPAAEAAAPVEDVEAPVPTEPEPEQEPEPAPAPAQFVEELEFPMPDEGGTMIIPPEFVNQALNSEQTELHSALPQDMVDGGATMVVPPIPELETASHEAVSHNTDEKEDLGLTEVLPALDVDEDVTFVLNRSEGKEISAHLICTTGPHAGEVLKLKSGVTVIGRASDSTFPLSKDKEASRRHALIVYETNKFVLQDQNSLNGTFVNDQLIKEPYPLHDGDNILIGVSTLKFQESPKK